MQTNQASDRTVFADRTRASLVLDEHRHIIHTSESARALIGARASDLLGRSIVDLATPEDRLRLGWWFSEHPSLSGGTIGTDHPPVAFRVARRHGMEVSAVAYRLPPLTPGEAQQYRVEFIPTSEGAPEDAQFELMVLRERVDQLDRANRQLETLAATAAHDLKSPLASLAMSVELLMRRTGSALDEPSQELVVDVLRGVRQMSDMVDGLLRCSLAGVRLIVAVVDGDALVEGLVRELGPELEAAEAVVKVAPIGSVVADIDQLRSVFHNLLSNAVRHRAQGRPLRIKIDVDDKPSRRTFRVTDNGPGIVPADRERVFGMFERLDRRTAGSGIGLATCQRIIEGHGGRIWLDDAPGGGTTVNFTLPGQRLFGV